jgi:hypothetical protein
MLYAAERVLGGARLYRDVVEINPPLIIALNLPAALLGRVLAVSDILIYRCMTLVLMAGGVAVADWSLRRTLEPNTDLLRRRLVLVLAFALFVLPGDSFGQREHLLVALALPYVLLAAGRVAGRPAPRGPSIAIGALAGLGLAIKPHFLLLWVAVEGYAAWRLRAKRPSYEAVGVVASVAVYLTGVAFLTPDYPKLVRLLGPAYFGFGHDAFLHVLVTAPGTAVCYLAVLAWTALRRQARHRDLWSVFLVAVVASFLAGASQQKGWGYHFYPSQVFALVLLALAVLDVRRPLVRLVPRLYAAVAFATVGATVFASTRTAIAWIRHRDPARESDEAQTRELIRALRRHMPPGGSLYILSYTIESSFPLVNYSGVRWASRFPCLWIIEAVYQDQLYAPSPLRFNRPEQMGPAERYLSDAVYADLARYRPGVLLVLRHARDVQGNGVRRVDYVSYFGRDPRIAGVLRHYRLADEVGQYLLYVRAATVEAPGQPPRSAPGRYDVARREVGTGGRAIVADRGFLVSTAVFLVLAIGGLMGEGSRRE